eukprot:3938527-Rhodomonas_salina.1
MVRKIPFGLLLWAAHLCTLGIVQSTSFTRRTSTFVDEIVLSPQSDAIAARIQGAKNGTVVTFLPGKYTGVCNISVTQDLVFRSTEGSSQTVLTCEHGFRHLWIAGAVHVQVHGIQFTKGRSDEGCCIMIQDGAHVHFNDSTFHSCDAIDSLALGGAITAKSSVLHLTNCVWLRCTASQGGAIYLSSSHLVANGNISLESCSGAWGGAIYAKNSHLELQHDVRVQACSATKDGGMVYLDESSMEAKNG